MLIYSCLCSHQNKKPSKSIMIIIIFEGYCDNSDWNVNRVSTLFHHPTTTNLDTFIGIEFDTLLMTLLI